MNQRKTWANDTYTENWGGMDYVLETTSWISYSLAPASSGCYMTGLELYKWYLTKKQQFDNFGDVFTAWLQNLLGNVITFNSLYKKVKEANDAENWRETYYWYGRFTTLFINFEPIEDDTLGDLDEFQDDDDWLFATDQKLMSFGLGLKAAHEALNSGRSVQRLPSDADETMQREGPVVGGFFGNAYGFTLGYVNSTFSESSPNMIICQETIANVTNEGKAFIGYMGSSDYDTLVSSAESFEAILGSVHPLLNSCYLGVFEYGQVAVHYKTTFTDFSHFFYNVIHSAGNTYDTIFYLLKHQKTRGDLAKMDGAAQRSWWFKLGIYYGTATHLLFYSGYSADPYDAYLETTGLQN